jgi:ATP-dependent Clp protease ATP-binding subunit ClpC
MRLLEDSLAEEILTGKVKEGAEVVVDVDDQGKVFVTNKSDQLEGYNNNLQLMPSAS